MTPPVEIEQTRPDFMYAIARLAIAYVEAGDADWERAKDASETDADLEPAWVEFRDEVRRLGVLADFAPAAPSTEPALDVERLGRAMIATGFWPRGYQAMKAKWPALVAAEYARLGSATDE